MRGRDAAVKALAAAAALGLALLLYAPSLSGGFVADDVLYIERNPLLSKPLLGALGDVVGEPAFTVGNWSPLHVAALHVEWQLFGSDPRGYRVVNVLLHVACAGALLAAARRAGLGSHAAGLAAVAFLVHPVAVETVAWINQSKTLLATLLALAALERWLAYLQSEVHRARRAATALGLALLAALAKPAAVALPLVLAIAVWTHGSVRRLRALAWLALLAIPTALVLVMNLLAQNAQGGIAASWFGGSAQATIRILPWVVWRYLRTSVLPTDLVFGVHPAPVEGWLDARLLVPLAACFAVMVVAAFAVRAQRCRGLAVAWFAAGLLPVIQVVPMVVIYADRYLYYALPGVLAPLAGAAAGASLRRGPRMRALLLAAIAVWLVALALETTRLARLWADPEALFTRSAAAYPLGRTGWIGLGAERQKRGDLDGAADAYLHALRLEREAHVHHLLGRVRLEQGRRGRALYAFEEALRLSPTHYEHEWMSARVAALRSRGVRPVPEP